MKLKSKLFAGVLGTAMILSTVAIPASAQTTAELTAQINSLLAMIAQLQAQIAGGTPTAGASVMFTSDLTIGSTGAEVTALQQWLVSKGYMVMPAGVAYGYFGPLTQSALAKYQAEAGISPAAGYFGPITRAKLNATAPTTPTTPGTTPTVGITTPGVEGTLTSSNSNAGLISTLYEGDSMVSVLGVKVDAKSSDIAVQRVKLELGTNTEIYNKIYSRLYVTEGGNTLASVDLNSSTVVKEGSNYYVTITGFNLVVPKDSSRTIVIKADARNTFDSQDVTNINADSARGRIRLAANGIRGVDGAGIDQYAGGATDGAVSSRTVTLSKGLSESATLKVSLNSSTVKKSEVVASEGSSNNELDKVTLFSFDVKAEKDAITITDLPVGVVKTGSGAATAPTAYLFDGSTELDNATVSGGVATFNDVDVTVAKDSTKTFTVKIDIRSANGTTATFQGSASTSGATAIVAENSKGDSVTKTGTATGNEIIVRNVGPEFTIVSKSITKSATPVQNNVSTSTAEASFVVRVKAVGGDIYFGNNASSTANRMFNNSSFVVYNGGAAATLNVASTTSFNQPSSVVTSVGSDSFMLPEGNTVDIPVSFLFEGRNVNSSLLSTGSYAVGLNGVNWSSDNGANISSSSFMAGELDWRTNGVTLP